MPRRLRSSYTQNQEEVAGIPTRSDAPALPVYWKSVHYATRGEVWIREPRSHQHTDMREFTRFHRFAKVSAIDVANLYWSASEQLALQYKFARLLQSKSESVSPLSPSISLSLCTCVFASNTCWSRIHYIWRSQRDNRNKKSSEIQFFWKEDRITLGCLRVSCVVGQLSSAFAGARAIEKHWEI
jgi:hypothetical protein